MDIPPCAFVIFGITGDLSARKLMPALHQPPRHVAAHLAESDHP